MTDATANASVTVEQPSPDVLLVRLSGNFREQAQAPKLSIVGDALAQSQSAKSMSFNSAALTGWDSRLVSFVRKCGELCQTRNIEFREDTLPLGIRRLLRLSNAVPERKEMRHEAVKRNFLTRLGQHLLNAREEMWDMLRFLGENVTAFFNLLRGRAQYRWSDAFLVMEECGPEALGIVAMINFLVGLIIAFVGAIELVRFGASIYVADLVGIATVREMGCIMTGIILCGRTGAAFAAQLGTMKVNEEISAYETFGLSPIEFLVLPRMIALMLVMPFLCAFADFISIAGGFVVSVSMLDVTPLVYLNRIMHAIEIKSFLLGIAKGTFFGFLVAYAGCFRGMRSGRSAAAVGEATTKAVVTGITAIIASDGVFAVLCNMLNI
jgi:phospholipid/cholesterol/gamma-HCH transport system permease protein